METYSKPSKTSLLPQYLFSEAMYERFLDATLNQDEEIQRAFNSKGIKCTDDYEIEYENLNFFIDNKTKFENEFSSELKERIGKKKSIEFCEIISNSWFDGRTKRESLPVLQLFASIKEYLLEKKVRNLDLIRVANQLDDDIAPNFTSNEINQILELNREMFDGYIYQWLENHPSFLDIGSGDIYCRRGMFLDNLMEVSEEYRELNFISSYSIAFSVTEKFAQLKKDSNPVIINTNLANLRERILFFSPFIKDMPPFQFELGVIPHWWRLRLFEQGIHGGINEFLVD